LKPGHFRFWVIFSTLAILLFFSSLSTEVVRAGQNPADMPTVQHTTPSPSAGFKITDCPPVSELPGPNRLVIQVIENCLYQWHEYLDPVTGSFYIYLLEPKEKALNATEAFHLLERSKKWEKQNLHCRENENIRHPDNIISQAPGERTYQNPQPEPGKLNQTRQYYDDRTSVCKDEVLTYPYYTIGFLKANYPGRNFVRATGFLISPHLALSNAHNLYSAGLGWFESIEFSPGQSETIRDEAVQPFSSLSPGKVKVNEDFIRYEGEGERDLSVKYDYAALFFDQPFTGISTFMPLEFNSHPSRVLIVGYPGIVNNENTLGMWRSEGEVLQRDDHLIFYAAHTTPGNSGSPIIVYDPPSETYRVVGIHTFTSVNGFGGGPFFNDYNRKIIEEWLNWEPALPPEDAPTLALNKSELVMSVGEKKVIIPLWTPKDPGVELIWSSSDEKVALVETDGVVSAVGPGRAIIAVQTGDSSQKAVCEVTVSSVVNETEIREDMPGDVNGDQIINVQDVVLTMRYILNLGHLDEEALKRADVNRDGEVNVADVNLIMQYSLGLTTSF